MACWDSISVIFCIYKTTYTLIFNKMISNLTSWFCLSDALSKSLLPSSLFVYGLPTDLRRVCLRCMISRVAYLILEGFLSWISDSSTRTWLFYGLLPICWFLEGLLLNSWFSLTWPDPSLLIFKYLLTDVKHIVVSSLIPDFFSF